MTKLRNSTLVAMALLSVGTLACRKAQEEPMSASPDRSASRDDEEDFDSQVHMDSKLAKMCDIPTPSFEFDSANVHPEAQAALDKLADCVVDGAAEDENLRLVGHADPRGDEEYNFALGQRRASSIARYLEDKGVGAERVETSSRGELDATGKDEDGFALDRRVDILLAG